MIYRKIRPSLPLQPLVECYYEWENHGQLPQAVQIESPPNGFTAMVFVYGDPYQIIHEGQQLVWVPSSFLSGQFTSNYQLKLTGKIGMFGVVFKPAALASVFRLNMTALVNQRVPLVDILGKEGQVLAARIEEAQHATERIAYIEQFLIDKLALKSFKVNYADYAVDIILERRGNVTVQHLADELGISRRLLEKQFITKVGLSPKYYARLKRISHVCALLIAQKEIDWQDAILLGGYYDQSHFIKDFLEFVRQNPSQYYKTHQELIKFLKE